MHLAIISPFPPTITGIGQYGYHVTRALAKSGTFSRITVLAGSHKKGEVPNHFDSTEIDYCWAPGQWKARSAILSRVKSLHPDLVWFNTGASIFGRSAWLNISGHLTPMIIRQLGYPTVVTLHELVELADLRTLNAPGGSFALAGARLFTKITSRADLVCLTLKEYSDWLSLQGVDCIHIPIGAYHEPELLEESNSQELLFFTTLAPFKGLDLLLKAFEYLRRDYPRIKLTVAGTEHVRFPDYPRQLKDQFSKLDGVNWLGQTSEEHVIELFRRAQIVVLPYTASTGSSSVLYQAATWGRAIVASNLKDLIKLAVESDLQVEFFETGNTLSLTGAIRNLIESKEKRIHQAEHNFNAILRTRPQETSRRYIQAFNRALEKRLSHKRIAMPIAGRKTA